ncbi:transglutaminase family protein [Terasakiella sp. A23]|uniref:transglutaminase family protein n=1 Tax=Terasakiella sp. FCG-A23 TaxID=3080561 RepID=UPI002955BE59|nr:transglutaminase family protein [Terasakiella sp. A23]MDV7341523.1 transglutaminase family protein [Terasakiella sp. A23]
MRIKIRHETHYVLETAARRAMQYLRLTPRNDRNQRVGNWSITGPEQLTPWMDGFGNTVHFAAEHTDHHDLKIVVEGEVETKETNGILPLDDGLPPGMFLRETPLIKCDDELARFVDQYASIRDKDGDIGFLHAYMGALADEIAYQSGESTVNCSAAEVFERKKGVCQDFAHLFIAGCHHLNIPSRYVSGYITDGAGEPASHAWAESYVSDLGWISFDPSNKQSATESYVRLAVAYDYASAAPIIGVRTGGQGEQMNVNVQVDQLQS